MVNKWVTIFIIILAAYSFMKQPSAITITPQEKQETYEVIDKIRDYVDVLTTSPKDASLNSKEKSLLPYNDLDSEGLAKVSPKKELENVKESSLPKENLPHQSISPSVPADEHMSMMQDKVVNVMYNLLHTKPGKAFLEKILLSPNINPDARSANKQPSQYINNSILDVIEGSGKQQANCGDVVEVNYIIRLVDGQEIENTYTNKKSVILQLGDHKVIKGLEYAIIGMKEGGVRRLVVPPKFAYQDQKLAKNMVAGNEFVTIDVELVKLKSSLSAATDNIRIFQESVEDKSVAMLCGDEVRFTYKLSTAEEEVIAQSNELVSFALGGTGVPPAINKAFMDIKTSSRRLVILPSSLLYNKKVNFLPATIVLPTKGMLLLEIYTFD